MRIYILLLGAIWGTQAWSEANKPTCSNISGNYHVTKNGRLTYTKNGKNKDIPAKSTTKDRVDYSVDTSFLAVASSISFKVNLTDGKSTSVETRDWAAVGGAGDAAVDTKYYLGYNSDDSCYIKTITVDGRVTYDNKLCDDLSQLVSELASPQEIAKCSQILNEMSETIKKYEAQKGLQLKFLQKVNPMENSLLFAANCRERLGYSEAHRMKSISPGINKSSATE